MKRSPIQRRTPMSRSSTPMKRGKRINPLGPKGKAWKDARADLKMEFLALGVTSCELRYQGCWFDDALGFAHAAKRRKLTAEDLKYVILCCNSCHNQIEFLQPEEMKRIVNETIQSRATLTADRVFP